MSIRTYTTRTGDTWDSIAYSLYRNEMRMTDLQHANLDHLHTLVFNAGVVLVVPEIEIPTAEVKPPWKQ